MATIMAANCAHKYCLSYVHLTTCVHSFDNSLICHIRFLRVNCLQLVYGDLSLSKPYI